VSWVLHRIDDRLIHGQVLVAWGQRLDPERIWVVDDGVAASPWERDLFREAAPGVDVHVLTVADAATAYAAETAAPGGAFLLVRDLITARRLAEAVPGEGSVFFLLTRLVGALGLGLVALFVFFFLATLAIRRFWSLVFGVLLVFPRVFLVKLLFQIVVHVRTFH
jgi:hypothetical protein